MGGGLNLKQPLLKTSKFLWREKCKSLRLLFAILSLSLSTWPSEREKKSSPMNWKWSSLTCPSPPTPPNVGRYVPFFHCPNIPPKHPLVGGRGEGSSENLALLCLTWALALNTYPSQFGSRELQGTSTPNSLHVPDTLASSNCKYRHFCDHKNPPTLFIIFIPIKTWYLAGPCHVGHRAEKGRYLATLEASSMDDWRYCTSCWPCSVNSAFTDLASSFCSPF